MIADDSVIAYLAATDLSSPQPVANIVVRDRATLALRWSSVSPPDVGSLPTPTLIAQGRLYAQSLAGGRPSIVAYAVDGCGKPPCSPVTVIDTGPGTNRLLAISVTEGTLFLSQTGAGISAYAPT